MRIPSGVTDQFVYFVAVDATDLATRETGLSSFTVYRSRNGAAAAAMTTPTVNETDSTNMPGVYELLLDEDMTIGSGNDTEEMCFHITHAGMAPVTRTIELYRAKITAGNTLGVAADGDLLEVNTLTGHTVQTGDSFARLGAPAGASVSADIAGLNDLSAAQVNAEVDTALADIHLDHLLAVDYDPATKPGVATALFNELVENDAGVSRFTVNALENGPSGSGASAAAIADAVWDEAQADHVTAGSFGEMATEVASILADTAEIGTAGAGLTAVPYNPAWDAEIQSEVTDALNAYDPPTRAELTSDIAGLNDLSAAQVNAEVVDVLRTDTVAEPTGVPSTTATLADKIGHIHMALVNQVTVTATKKTIHDSGGTAEWEKDLSDDGTTYTETAANAI